MASLALCEGEGSFIDCHPKPSGSRVYIWQVDCQVEL